MNDLSDEQIQAQLAGETLRGPRAFRNRPLAALSRGLRDLRNKVVAPDDTGDFHDCALLHILAEAHAVADAARLEKRRALLVATDDVATFRATVNLLLDDWSDEEKEEARRLTNEILGLVKLAEVTLEKKSAVAPELPAPSLTTTPSPSSPSPVKRAGRRKSSAGS